jgi:hypothetical protein
MRVHFWIAVTIGEYPFFTHRHIRALMGYKKNSRPGSHPDHSDPPWGHGGIKAYTEKEGSMDTMNQGTTVHRFDSSNYVGTESLPRDRTQSDRLHQPEQMLTCIDPISGRYIEDLAGHPFIIDGNVTMYFESEETRQEYLDTPMDHPFRLVDNPTDEGYDEG